MKIGVMFGNPETTTGGNALKFYASVRLDIRRIGALKDGEQVVGNRTRVKVVKNKMAPPFREAEFDIVYGQGISRAGEIIDLGVEAGLLEKSGAWIAYGGERLGNGREAARQYLLEHQDLLKELRTQAARARGDRRCPRGARGRRSRRRARRTEGGLAMVIEMLPALMINIRAAAIANENAARPDRAKRARRRTGRGRRAAAGAAAGARAPPPPGRDLRPAPATSSFRSRSPSACPAGARTPRLAAARDRRSSRIDRLPGKELSWTRQATQRQPGQGAARRLDGVLTKVTARRRKS